MCYRSRNEQKKKEKTRNDSSARQERRTGPMRALPLATWAPAWPVLRCPVNQIRLAIAAEFGAEFCTRRKQARRNRHARTRAASGEPS